MGANRKALYQTVGAAHGREQEGAFWALFWFQSDWFFESGNSKLPLWYQQLTLNG